MLHRAQIMLGRAYCHWLATVGYYKCFRLGIVSLHILGGLTTLMVLKHTLACLLGNIPSLALGGWGAISY